MDTQKAYFLSSILLHVRLNPKRMSRIIERAFYAQVPPDSQETGRGYEAFNISDYDLYDTTSHNLKLHSRKEARQD
eukprot:m.162982 g.162982  ORF g.162982 m.162982 type:complete len:76 (+) comp14615_c0_seq8:3552-3779(+)